MSLSVTLDQVITYDPCYPRDYLDQLAYGQTEAPLVDVLRREDIPPEDRIWLACQHLARVDPTMLSHFAHACTAAKARGRSFLLTTWIPACRSANDDSEAADNACHIARIAAASFPAGRQSQIDWLTREIEDRT